MKNMLLRWRLTWVTVLILTTVCAASTTFSIYGTNKNITAPLSNELYTIAISTQMVSDTTEEMFFIYNENGLDEFHPLDVEKTAPITVSGEPRTKFIFSGEVSDAAQSGNAEGYSGQVEAVELLINTKESADQLHDQVATAAFTIDVGQEAFNYYSLLLMGILVVLGGVLTYFATGYALRPVKTFSQEIQEIGGEQLSHRIEAGDGAKEISQLANSFNEMLERVETAFTAQKRFSTAAAHELKTPLAAIQTNMDVLDMDEAPSQEEYAETVQVIRRQTQRMTRLVDDLFAMSALQDCGIEEEIDMLSLVQNQIDDLAHAAREKQVSIQVEGEFSTVQGNSVILSRAIGNLLENAIRYTVPSGFVTVRAAVEGEQLKLVVADNGPGIPPEHLPHIFEAFYRADPSRSRKLGGAGLGLSIAKEIVNLHGGQLEAENLEGGGAAFTITLPCKVK